jgi:hypothetical protein
MAALRSLTDEEQRERDLELIRIARGVGAVDRAVRAYRERRLACFKIPVDVALRIGWPICDRCRRPITPWQVIRWRTQRFHPTCVNELLVDERKAA